MVSVIHIKEKTKIRNKDIAVLEHLGYFPYIKSKLQRSLKHGFLKKIKRNCKRQKYFCSLLLTEQEILFTATAEQQS